MIKTCTICGNSYPETSEYFVTSKGKIQSRCRICSREQSKKWKQEHKEYVAAYKAYYNPIFYQRHKEKIKAKTKKYYQEHKDYFKKYREENSKEQNAKYYQKYKEKIKAKRRKYYQEHKDYFKKYYQENKEKYQKKCKGQEI